MPLALPNLDDRRWAELVEEGRALIPYYAPEWTDHNAHDPGITLMELFAWVAEMDIFQLNRVSDAARRKFLSLVGIRPEPPRAARTVLSITPVNGQTQLVPPSVEFEAAGTRFRTLEAVTAAPARVDSVQVQDTSEFHDLTRRLARGETVDPLGDDPRPGAALYIGFAAPLPEGVPVSVFLDLGDLASSDGERWRVQRERADAAAACPPSTCDSYAAPPAEPARPCVSVRVVWEFLTASGNWTRFTEVADRTESLRWTDAVVLTPREAMSKAALGAIDRELYYIRARFAGGSFDQAPALRQIVVNGVRAEQANAGGPLTWKIVDGATVEGTEPKAGDMASFTAVFNASNEITTLSFGTAGPQFRILVYEHKPAGTGTLTIEAEVLGRGNGRPHQQFQMRSAPVVESSVRLYTLEEAGWREWTWRDDFDASGRADAHFLLDATRGTLTTGDGDHGRAVPSGARVIAVYDATRAEAGNIASGAVFTPADSPHNRAISGFDAKNIASTTNVTPGEGGAAEETLDHAAGRAVEFVQQRGRAVTLEDYEALARETPGVHLARVYARANLHPAFPCYQAPGVVTLVIVPFLPAGKPFPSRCVLSSVSAYLGRRRIIGSRLEVIGPAYVEIGVRATVQALEGTVPSQVRDRVAAALSGFLDPLAGGPDRTGWPFGRWVYRSEVLEVIDRVPGIDHVLDLELTANGGDPRCGNICIPPAGLVASGGHEITVQGGADACA